jgi:hypothetical protein
VSITNFLDNIEILSMNFIYLELYKAARLKTGKNITDLPTPPAPPLALQSARDRVRR